jgi:LacI family transcriptional regulator
MGLAALRVATSRGLKSPGDLAIVSFDDTPIVKFSHPPLTAIVQPIAAMTAEASRLLIRAKAGDADLPSSVVVPFGLAIRDSTRRV